MNVPSVNKMPNRYLITIGSSHCPNINQHPLNHIETDIERVEKLFTKEEQGYKRILVNNIKPGSTSSKIKEELKSWFISDERSKSDYVIVYYAGHGDYGNESGSHYLYTIESRQDDLDDTAIKTSDLVKCFFPGTENSPGNVLLILDVCYAGQGATDAVIKSLTEHTNATKNKFFGIIATANSKTEAGDGDFVDALEAVMENSDWMGDNKEEFIALEFLVLKINEELNKQSKAQKAIRHDTGSSEPPSFIRNPCYQKKRSYKKSQTPQQHTKRKKPTREELSDVDKLEKALKTLNHSKQSSNFERLIKNNKAVCFHIQTLFEHQTPLLWLLKSLIKDCQEFDIVTVPFDTYINEDFLNSINHICYQLNLSACNKRKEEEVMVKELIDKICKRTSKSEYIILLLDSVNTRTKDYLDKIFKTFVNCLGTKMAEADTSWKFLMFWINFDKDNNLISSYNILDEPCLESPDVIYNIPLTTKFEKHDVEAWIRGQGYTAVDRFNRALLGDDVKIRNTIEEVWSQSQEGNPKLLLQAIYELCNLSWEKYEDKWSKLV